MKLTTAIAQHVTEAAEGVNWTEVDLKNVLSDISFEEAVTKTIASPNSIAEIVYHLNYYNNRLLARVNGINNAPDEANGFDMPALQNEEEWNALRANNILSARTLADAVGKIDDDKIFDLNPANHQTFYKNLHGCVEHVYYHLGQIFILKNLIRTNRS
jgi:hypothetical protein